MWTCKKTILKALYAFIGMVSFTLVTSFPFLCTAFFVCLIVCLLFFLLGLCAVCLFSRAFHGWLVCRTLQLCFPALFPAELFPAFNTLGLSCVLHRRFFFPRFATEACFPALDLISLFAALYSSVFLRLQPLSWLAHLAWVTRYLHVAPPSMFYIFCSEFRLAYKLHVVFLLCIIVR